MIRQRTCFVPCLVLTCILIYAWAFVDGFISDDNSRLLGEEALRAARDSVHISLQAELLKAIQNGLDNLGTKPERLQPAREPAYGPSPSTKNLVDTRSATTRGGLVPDADHDLCPSLAGKRITMVGGEHIYHLHLYLLQHQERAERKPFPCPYHDVCTHHHICLPFQPAPGSMPQPRYIKPPSTQELVETRSSAVNYIVSDTLLSTPNASSWEYNLPYLDPLTGVRSRETYWLAAARKAHVIILGRGPLSAPGQTYTGNWSFLRQIPNYVNQSCPEVATAAHRREDTHATVPCALEILNAAVHLTVSRFLPDLFQLLVAIRREVHLSRQKRFIWPSGWYRFPDRGTPLFSGFRSQSRFSAKHRFEQEQEHAHILVLHFSELLKAETDGTNMALREDPWTWLFNAQVYLQNMVLRELLPLYGVVFLPLHDISWAKGARGKPDPNLVRMTAVKDQFLTGLLRML